MKILSELPLEGDPMHRIGGQDLCKLFDLSPAGLSDLKKRGIVVQHGHDTYDLAASVTAYVTHLRGIAAGWGTADQAAQLTTERARLAKEQADAQAIKNAKLRGELVEADQVERTWADTLRHVRSRILAVPSRIRSKDPSISRGTIETLDRALRDALTELGDGN